MARTISMPVDTTETTPCLCCRKPVEENRHHSEFRTEFGIRPVCSPACHQTVKAARKETDSLGDTMTIRLEYYQDTLAAA